MICENGLIIPANWLEEAAEQIGRLRIQPPFQLLPVPDYEKSTKRQLAAAIAEVLEKSSLRSAVVILPMSYASGNCLKFWPEMMTGSQSKPLIISVCFADNWPACQEMINGWLVNRQPTRETYHATCQYQLPYTETLNAWANAGAKSYHPGDYTKQEFLNCLSQMEGHWLYWGHSEMDKLRGYRHLSSQDLLSYRPQFPLRSTLWFSCSTLSTDNTQGIGLDWFLSGSTQFLMASPKPIKTADNQLLGSAWLEACSNLQKPSSIADIIHYLLKKDSKTFDPILRQYHLLGCVWVGFV